MSIAEHQAEAARLIQALEQYLTLNGYKFIAISIAKLVRTEDGHCATPGASALVVDRTMAPGLPHEARALRALADKLDTMFEESRSYEAEESTIEDATNVYYPAEAAR